MRVIYFMVGCIALKRNFRNVSDVLHVMAKDHSSMSQCIDYSQCFRGAQLLPLYTYPHDTSHIYSPRVMDGSYRLLGQQVKGQGHNVKITENGFRHITAFSLHQSSSKFK